MCGGGGGGRGKGLVWLAIIILRSIIIHKFSRLEKQINSRGYQIIICETGQKPFVLEGAQ